MNKSICLFVLMLACCMTGLNPAKAQWYDPEKVNRKAREVYEQAYQKAVEGEYEASVRLLETALLEEPRFVEVYLSRAGIYADMKDYRSSVRDFRRAFELDSVFSSTYLLPFSISLAGTGEFTQALNAVTRFLQTPGLNQQSIKAGNYRRSVYEFAIERDKKLAGIAYDFSPVNLGDSVNSTHLEYYPSVTVDGKKLVMTRRVDDDEDFFESDFRDGKWGLARPLTGKINTNLNEGAQNISQDGNWLVFTGCNYPEGQGSCDLYISYRNKNGGWTEPENLGKRVNTDAWESSPSLSPDKKDLYFSSNRPDGFGGLDIWVSHKQSNGAWTDPVNLGPDVNTGGDESCPFIHADNSTLYFNSNGHPGYGMTDLFLTRRLTDSTWSQPDNLGYPINTIDDEGSLVVAADGMTTYYASDKGEGKGGLDLYTFKLRPDIRALHTTWVKGRVYDSKTGQGLPSTVELTEIDTRRVFSRLQTDEDGNYLVTLPEGKQFAFNVNRKGYLFYSDHFEIGSLPPDSFLTANIPLQPIEAGAFIVLKNIFFESKKAALSTSSMNELDKVVQLMMENPRLKIIIGGHTDNIGKKEDNQALSLNRATSVTQYLVSKGINAGRLQPKGYGDSKPVASNNTDQGKSLNRRTELNVLSN